MKILTPSSLRTDLPDADDWKRKRQEIQARKYPRKEVADLLSAYQLRIGNDPQSLASVEALRSPQTVAVVGGQQLGFMGGPAFTILKAITVILAARELQAVPVFWLATEDHDLAEIDHTYLLDERGNLKRFHLPFPKKRLFVEDLHLNATHVRVIEEFLDSVHLSDLLTSWYIEEGMSYSQAMAGFLARLFAGTGLVFVEPYLLRPLARDFFQHEIKESNAILKVLQGTTHTLQAAGEQTVLSFEESTNLFYKSDDGLRLKIRKQRAQFTIGEEEISEKDLLLKVELTPERFSANVAARPVMQSYLLPAIAYAAGPTEKRYYQQLMDYHRFHSVPMPLVISRLSATMIPAEVAGWMDQCGIKPDEGLPGSWKEWSERHPNKQLPNIPSHAFHLLNNLILPHQKPQERVLNWCEFQKYQSESLIQTLLKTLDWRSEGHQYLVL